MTVLRTPISICSIESWVSYRYTGRGTQVPATHGPSRFEVRFLRDTLGPSGGGRIEGLPHFDDVLSKREQVQYRNDDCCGREGRS